MTIIFNDYAKSLTLCGRGRDRPRVVGDQERDVLFKSAHQKEGKGRRDMPQGVTREPVQFLSGPSKKDAGFLSRVTFGQLQCLGWLDQLM